MGFFSGSNSKQARISADEGRVKIANGALLIDVRTADEYAGGHVASALHIPYDELESRIAELGSDKDREIVLYCHSGARSGSGQKTLTRLGFTRSYNAGGIDDWNK